MADARMRLLLVDDDDLFCMAVGDLLADAQVDIVRVSSLAEARQLGPARFHVVVLDDRLPDGRGLDLLDVLRAEVRQPRVVVVSGVPDIDMAIAALRYRALDFLYKPIEPDALLRLVRSARPPNPRAGATFDGAFDDQLLRYAASDMPLLLRGETGTGKTSLARRLHAASPRASGPFVMCNCGALPEALIESELFGSERGAYTGAGVARAGLIESAAGGTFFLDEIGELPLACQAKLLDVLESKCLRRVGAVHARQIDVRFMAATHVDLEAAAEARRFRRDLLFRLDVLRIELPTLRSRPNSLPGLVAAILRDLEIERPLADGEIERLAAHAWPGNIRELRNVLQRAAMMQPEGALAPAALLAPRVTTNPPAPAQVDEAAGATIEEISLRHMAEVVARSPTRKHAAAVLGIGESTLRRKLKQAKSARFERLP
jgi:two-component system response regulator PilR (NtrC family)